MAHSDKPRLDWTAANLPETFQLFKQRCQIYFDIKDIKVEKQVSHILFFTGDEGLYVDIIRGAWLTQIKVNLRLCGNILKRQL